MNFKQHVPQSIRSKYRLMHGKYRTSKELVLGLLAKKMISEGKVPFFVPKVEKIQQKWLDLPEEVIKNYAIPQERSEYLYKQLQINSIDFNAPVFEIGTNVGRNLNYLFHKGYKNLHGIEINKKAIDLMKKLYPDLKASIIYGPLENKIKDIPDNQFSLTFSMAVLMHISPQSHFIFKEISRITNDFIIIIEVEDYYHPPNFYPRSYYDIFTKLGWKQIHSEYPQHETFPTNHSKYVMRVFTKNLEK